MDNKRASPIAEIRDASQHIDDMILIYCHGPQNLIGARNIIKNLKTNFLIYYYDVDFADNFLADLVGIKITNDINFCILNHHLISLVIIFGTRREKQFLPSIRLLNFYNAIGIITLDMQHGLFQEELNFSDSSKILGFNSNNKKAGTSVPGNTVATRLIEWFNNDSVGYIYDSHPLGNLDNSKKLVIGICTNLNWHIYTDEERFIFYSFVLRLAHYFRDLSFIWRPHPAEFNEKYSKFMCQLHGWDKPDNLYIDSTNRGAFSPISSFISRCDFALLTPGTSVLDFYNLQVPISIYMCQGNRKILSALKEFPTFNSFDQIYTQIIELYLGKKLKKIKLPWFKKLNIKILNNLIIDSKRKPLKSLPIGINITDFID